MLLTDPILAITSRVDTAPHIDQPKIYKTHCCVCNGIAVSGTGLEELAKSSQVSLLIPNEEALDRLIHSDAQPAIQHLPMEPCTYCVRIA